MEFMSQNLPVVLSHTRIDSLYFNDSVVAFFQSGNYEDLADKVRRVAREQLCASYAYVQANS